MHPIRRLTLAASLILAPGWTLLAQAPAAEPALAPSAPAADALFPKAEVVLERYIEAIGGRTALEKITSRKMVSTMEMPTANMKMTSTVWSQAPNVQVMEMSIPGMGEMFRGTDGTIAWEVTPMGPRLLKGAELRETLRLSMFHIDLKYSEIYEKIEVVGKERVERQECYKVAFTPKEGEPSTSFYSMDTGLMVKSMTTVKHQMGPMKSESLLSDYREVDGVKIPHQVKASTAGVPGEMIMTVDKVEHNVEIPAEKLQPPPAIQKLLEKEKNKPASDAPATDPK
jgi:zinc protease